MDSSPFSSLLHTNYAPTEAEARAIRESCGSPLRELSLLETQIAALQARRDELKAQIEAHLMLLSPIRRLSPEMLQSIFIFCIPDDRNPAIHGSEAPLLLTAVCRGWREIATNTPILWIKIHISIPQVNVDSESHAEQRTNLSNRCLGMVKAWLGRSGSDLPLSISVASDDIYLQQGTYHGRYYARRVGIYAASSTASELGAAIADYAHRWMDVQLKLSTPLLGKLIRSFKKSTPVLSTFKLEELTIPGQGQILDGTEKLDEEISFLMDAPIQHLQLQSLALLSFASFNGANLQELSLSIGVNQGYPEGGGTSQTLLRIFITCPRLETLELNILSPPEWESEHTGYITHPKLRSLRPISHNEDYTIALWKRLYLPSLCGVSVTFVQCMENRLVSDMEEPLKDLVHRSLPTFSLTEVTVDFPSPDRLPFFLVFLRECIYLTSLDVTVRGHAASISRPEEEVNLLLRALFVPGKLQAFSTILPHLTSLAIGCDVSSSFGQSSLLRQCLDSRLRPSMEDVVGLETFTLRYEQPVEGIDIREALKALEYLEKQGLKISIEALDIMSPQASYSPFFGLTGRDHTYTSRTVF